MSWSPTTTSVGVETQPTSDSGECFQYESGTSRAAWANQYFGMNVYTSVVSTFACPVDDGLSASRLHEIDHCGRTIQAATHRPPEPPRDEQVLAGQLSRGGDRPRPNAQIRFIVVVARVIMVNEDFANVARRRSNRVGLHTRPRNPAPRHRVDRRSKKRGRRPETGLMDLQNQRVLFRGIGTSAAIRATHRSARWFQRRLAPRAAAQAPRACPPTGLVQPRQSFAAAPVDDRHLRTVGWQRRLVNATLPFGCHRDWPPVIRPRSSTAPDRPCGSIQHCP